MKADKVTGVTISDGMLQIRMEDGGRPIRLELTKQGATELLMHMQLAAAIAARNEAAATAEERNRALN